MGRLGERDSAARQSRELAGVPNAADFSEALARGLAVLAAFGRERRALTQAELARELGLSRATVRRAVLTLHHLGYLEVDGRSYQLSPRILRLAEGYLTSNIVSSVVQPVCERICARLHESCTVAVLDGPHAVMVARAVPNRLISVGGGLGYRVPAARSALGQVLLAHLGADEAPVLEVPGLEVSGLEAAVPGLDAAAGLEAPGLEVAGLGAGVLERVRADGYSYVANDVEAGFHSLAVPLRRWDGRPVAAMNVGCNVERIPPSAMRGEVLELLRATAAELRPHLI